MNNTLKTWAASQEEEDLMNDDHLPLWRQLIALAVTNDISDKSVLDYGCNQGGFLYNLYQAHPFREGMGVDIAMASLAVAAQRLKDLPATTGHVDTLKKYPESFDIAFSHEVLYLLPDLQAHAAVIKKALRPGGVYFAAIGCHTDQPLWNDWKTLIGNYSNVPVQDYSLDDYAGAFFDEGFICAVQPFRTQGFFPLQRHNPYFPKVVDSIRYYQNDKVLFCFKKNI